MKKDVIITASKIKFDPINPSIEDINIYDIAHSLSLICRGNGHIKYFYSVAQHSLNCMYEAKARGLSERVQLACLLHDASESYICDIPRPLKKNLHNYLEIEEILQNKIYQKYLNEKLTNNELYELTNIDDSILWHEFLELFDEKISQKEPDLLSKPNIKQSDFKLIENEFLYNFRKLTGEALKPPYGDVVKSYDTEL